MACLPISSCAANIHLNTSPYISHFRNHLEDHELISLWLVHALLSILIFILHVPICHAAQRVKTALHCFVFFSESCVPFSRTDMFIFNNPVIVLCWGLSWWTSWTSSHDLTAPAYIYNTSTLQLLPHGCFVDCGPAVQICNNLHNNKRFICLVDVHINKAFHFQPIMCSTGTDAIYRSFKMRLIDLNLFSVEVLLV